MVRLGRLDRRRANPAGAKTRLLGCGDVPKHGDAVKNTLEILGSSESWLRERWRWEDEERPHSGDGEDEDRERPNSGGEEE